MRPETFRPAPRKRTPDERPSSAVRGYRSAAWDRLRRLCYTRDAGQCQMCKRIVGKSREVHIDHIKPKAQGGADDLGNLQTLCASCHAKKTRAETRKV